MPNKSNRDSESVSVSGSYSSFSKTPSKSSTSSFIDSSDTAQRKTRNGIQEKSDKNKKDDVHPQLPSQQPPLPQCPSPARSVTISLSSQPPEEWHPITSSGSKPHGNPDPNRKSTLGMSAKSDKKINQTTQNISSLSRSNSRAKSEPNTSSGVRLTEDGLEEAMDRLYCIPARKQQLQRKKDQEDLDYLLSFLQPTRPKSRASTRRNSLTGSHNLSSINGSTTLPTCGGGGGFVMGNTMRLSEEERKILLDVFANQQSAGRTRMGLGGQWCWPQPMCDNQTNRPFSPGSFRHEDSIPLASGRVPSSPTTHTLSTNDDDTFIGPPTIQLPPEVIEYMSERLHREGIRSPSRGQRQKFKSKKVGSPPLGSTPTPASSTRTDNIKPRHPACIWPKEDDVAQWPRLPDTKIVELATRFHGEYRERVARQEEAENALSFHPEGRWMGPPQGLPSSVISTMLHRLANPNDSR